MDKLFGYAGYAAFGVALTAVLASLVASEFFNLPPCDLCWYQRVFMYPIVVIIGIGIIRRDANWPVTVLVLSGIGWLIALYHSLLQWSILPSSLAPCTGGISCASPGFDAWFGFITIPFMSFVAFTGIIILTIIFWKGVQSEQGI